MVAFVQPEYVIYEGSMALYTSMFFDVSVGVCMISCFVFLGETEGRTFVSRYDSE